MRCLATLYVVGVCLNRIGTVQFTQGSFEKLLCRLRVLGKRSLMGTTKMLTKPLFHGYCQCVLTDNSNCCEAHIECHRAVVAIGHQSIWLNDIILANTQSLVDLGEQPNDFSITEIATRVIDAFAIAKNGVEEQSGIAILNGGKTTMGNAQYSPLISRQAIKPYKRLAPKHWRRRIVDGHQVHLADFPVQPPHLYCLFEGGRLGKSDAEAVPRHLARIKHFPYVRRHASLPAPVLLSGTGGPPYSCLANLLPFGNALRKCKVKIPDSLAAPKLRGAAVSTHHAARGCEKADL